MFVCDCTCKMTCGIVTAYETYACVCKREKERLCVCVCAYE